MTAYLWGLHLVVLVFVHLCKKVRWHLLVPDKHVALRKAFLHLHQLSIKHHHSASWNFISCTHRHKTEGVNTPFMPSRVKIFATANTVELLPWKMGYTEIKCSRTTAKYKSQLQSYKERTMNCMKKQLEVRRKPNNRHMQSCNLVRAQVKTCNL